MCQLPGIPTIRDWPILPTLGCTTGRGWAMVQDAVLQDTVVSARVNPSPFNTKTGRRVVGFPTPSPATEHNLKNGQLGSKPSVDLRVLRPGCLGALVGFCFLSS